MPAIQVEANEWQAMLRDWRGLLNSTTMSRARRW